MGLSPRAFFKKWLGVGSSDAAVHLRLDSLEKNLTIVAGAVQRTAETLAVTEERIFGVLQPLIDGLTTLDKKHNARRASDFLGHVSDIYPKKKIALFMGRSYFGDNIKYAFLAFCAARKPPEVSAYFLPRDERQYQQLKMHGLPCLPVEFADYSSEDIEILLGAKILVLDEQFMPPNWRQFEMHALLHGAKTIQLWHGIGVKKAGLELVSKAKFDDPVTPEVFASNGIFDVFIGLSEASQEYWRRKCAFRQFSPIGYARDDVFFRDINAMDAINTDGSALATIQTASKDKPAFLYVPTFREHGGIAWFETAQIAVFADYCHKYGYPFYVNLHPGEQSAIEVLRKTYPTVKFITPGTDIYPIVKYVGVMITDYSSLACDFLLLDRPILFYRPDHADYVLKSRLLVEDHMDYVCGPVLSSMNELIQAANEAVTAIGNSDADKYRNIRHTLRDKLFDHKDDQAGERLSALIIEKLNS